MSSRPGTGTTDPRAALAPDDEAGIHRTLIDYCWSLDRPDWDLMESVFASDAVLTSPSQGNREGPASIVEGMRGSRERFERTHHLLGNVRIRPESASAARVTSYVLGHDVRTGATEELVRVAAYYHDRVAKHGDVWLIAERRIEVIWVDKI